MCCWVLVGGGDGGGGVGGGGGGGGDNLCDRCVFVIYLCVREYTPHHPTPVPNRSPPTPPGGWVGGLVGWWVGGLVGWWVGRLVSAVG